MGPSLGLKSFPGGSQVVMWCEASLAACNELCLATELFTASAGTLVESRRGWPPPVRGAADAACAGRAVVGRATARGGA